MHRYISSVPAYGPDDVPESALERASIMAAECFDPKDATECAAWGVAESRAWLSIDRKATYWSLYPDECGMTASVDGEEFLKTLDWETDQKAAMAILLDYVGVGFEPTGWQGRSTRVFADWNGYGDDDERLAGWDCEDLTEQFRQALEDAYREVETEFMRIIESDYEGQTSHDAIRERMRDLDEMILDDGTLVAAADCEEEPEQAI